MGEFDDEGEGATRAGEVAAEDPFADEALHPAFGVRRDECTFDPSNGTAVPILRLSKAYKNERRIQ